MAIKQGFPNTDSPILDQNGALSLTWLLFFRALFDRTGSGDGNNSAAFNYPDTDGTSGQVLTSSGAAAPTIWTTLRTKLGQFTNDVGFITIDALSNLSSKDQTDNAISSYVTGHEADFAPPPDSTNGSSGVSLLIARADHDHPREKNPVFQGTVTANRFMTGGVSWSSGSGPPGFTQPNGSLYSNAIGGTGTRLYVSNGASWTAVPGV